MAVRSATVPMSFCMNSTSSSLSSTVLLPKPRKPPNFAATLSALPSAPRTRSLTEPSTSPSALRMSAPMIWAAVSWAMSTG